MAYSVRNIVIALVLALVAAGTRGHVHEQRQEPGRQEHQDHTVVVFEGRHRGRHPLNTWSLAAPLHPPGRDQGRRPRRVHLGGLAEHLARDRDEHHRRRADHAGNVLGLKGHGDREPDSRHDARRAASFNANRVLGRHAQGRRPRRRLRRGRSRPATTTASTARRRSPSGSSQRRGALRLRHRRATTPLTSASGANSASGTSTARAVTP